jgi:uncharacterized protein (DUF488 family)
VKCYTIGYGGRRPEDFLALLTSRGIRAVADVRLRPDRAHMGCYAQAKDPNRGLQGLLEWAGIEYVSFPELGNVFLHRDDWVRRYRTLLEQAGDLLTEGLTALPTPFCLLCAEKRASECHRSLVADYLAGKGYEIEHIE